MLIERPFQQSLLMLALSASTPLYAQNDAESRIKDLENKVQQLIEQRAEQDKQIELLTKDLVGISKQVSQTNIVKSEEKGASKGSPVYATFKDGIQFEDGSGHWGLQFNGRVQADYRTFDGNDQPDTWRK